MDRGKRPGKFLSARNSKIFMDLKDIIREHALPFLPAKSLFRFQVVCRDWKLQISTPFFAHNQSLSCRTILGLFCQTPGEPPVFISVHPTSCGVPDPSLEFLPEAVDIRSSSNGLLCCQAHTGDRAYYVCNPVTKQWKELPKPNAYHGSDPAVVLVFEPSLLNFEADFKLICAFQSRDFDDAMEFEIFSSKEGSWKISGEICFATRSVNPRSGIHAKGVVYWKLSRGSFLAFDLTKDRSQLLQSYSYAAGSCSLGLTNGKLCSAFVNSQTIILNELANIHTNTMQMNSNVRMWEEKHRITLDSKVLGTDAVNHELVFVGDDLVVVRSGQRMYSYDLKTKETIALSRAPELRDMRCVPYVNSLVSL